MASRLRSLSALAAVFALTLACAGPRPTPQSAEPAPATPIRHLVVIWQENISFDHYFATYPHAANIDGTPFTAKPDTPAVDGLNTSLKPSTVCRSFPNGRTWRSSSPTTTPTGGTTTSPPVIVSASTTSEDALNGPNLCGDPAAMPIAYQGRCGYGPRLPLLVISPYAKANFVDHTLTDQTSITRFIEDNWNTGRIGDHSFDERAGALTAMFDFNGPTQPTLTLNSNTGNP